MRTIEEILGAIDRFKPDAGSWIELEHLLSELWETKKPEQGLEHMLNVLERFPDCDGAGVLWSIVHGIETFPSYEGELLLSIRRQPSMLGLAMLHRIENAGASRILGQEIKSVYSEILAHPKLPSSLRGNVVAYRNSV